MRRAADTEIELALAGISVEAVFTEAADCTVADGPAATAAPGSVPKESIAPTAIAVRIFGAEYLGI